ncbi:MAG: hypothetical protein E7277_08485 [Lachnospiraceae bacterium]|jgi:ABC-2 type transport system permease protein|nr:hypothetical protein [Lachnospiraceae bacterium]
MKSKISCFKGILIKRDWRFLFGICGVYGFVLYSSGAHALIRQMRMSKIGVKNDYLYEKTNFLCQMGGSFHVFLVAILAIICALICFHYLYDKRGVQMMHALPVSRRQMFVSHYMDGLATLLLPLLVNMGIMASILKKASLVEVSCTFYGELMIAAFLFYSMMVLLIMICGVAFLPPVLFFIFNYLFLGIMWVADRICQGLIYGFYGFDIGRGDGFMGYICMLSPLKYLYSGTGITVRQNSTLVFVGAKFIGWYVVAALVMTILAYVMYRTRPVESWGDFLTKPWLKIFFTVGISGCVELIIFCIIINREVTKHSINTLGKVNSLIVLLTTLVVYYIVSMIVRKTLHVWKRKAVYIPAFGMAAVLCGMVLAVQNKADEIAVYLPEKNEIKKVIVDASFLYSTAAAKTDIDDALALNQKIIEERQYVEDTVADNIYSVSFLYELKNGKKLNRRYCLPFDVNHAKKEGCLEKAMEKYFCGFDRVPKTLFEQTWQKVSLVKSIGDETKSIGQLPEAKMKKAILADIEEGSLKSLYFANVTDTITGKNVIVIQTRYLNNVAHYEVGNLAGVSIENRGEDACEMKLRIDENCKHTLQVLKENGITMEKLKEGQYVEAVDMEY